MEKKFSAKEAIQFGWQTMKSNFWFFVGLLPLAGFIYIIPSVVSELIRERNPIFSFVWDIIGIALSIIVTLGLIKISLNFCDNTKSAISDILSQYPLFFRFLFATILYNLIVLAGLILLIIPGIYLAIRLQLYRHFIVDRNSGIKESLMRSWDITGGSFWNLFVFGLLLTFMNLAGALVFLIGLFITIPTTIVAFAFVYRKLLRQIEPAQPLTAPLTTPFA